MRNASFSISGRGGISTSAFQLLAACRQVYGRDAEHAGRAVRRCRCCRFLRLVLALLAPEEQGNGAGARVRTDGGADAVDGYLARGVGHRLGDKLR